MGARVERLNGQNYSDNVIDELLAFNRTQTWTVSSGTGSGTITSAIFFEGNSSLRLINTAPTTDLVVTNSAQSTEISEGGIFGFSLFLRKSQPLEFMTIEVNVFQNASLFDTQTFVLGSETEEDDFDNVWVRFDTFENYNFNKGDDITFTFTLKGKAGTSLLNTTVWIDGLMLYCKDRNNAMPPSYVPPIYNKTVQSPNVVLENLTAEQYRLSALNTAPSSATDTGTLGEIRITATHIYVCTAEDVWVRADLATW